MSSVFESRRLTRFKAPCLLGALCVGMGLTSVGMLSARTDLVMLTSGERIMGEVLPQSNEETLVLKSALLGEISLPRSGVVRIEAVPTAEDKAAAEMAVSAPGTPEKSKAQAAKKTPEKPEKAVAANEKKPDGPTDEELKAAKTVEIAALVEEETDIYERLLGFKAPDSWKGNLRVGMNISSGDKKWTETALRGNLEIKEKGSRNFYRLTGSYTYRETERNNGDTYKSTDRYDGAFTYRRSISEDWFFQNALGARVDQVKGIDREVQDTVGIGYKYKPMQKFEVLFGGGGGVEDYQTTFDDTREGVNGVMNVFQELTWHPFTRTSVIQKFNYYWNPESSEQYNYVISAAVRLRLTDLLGFEFSYNKNYDNDIGNGNPKDDTIWRNAIVVYF